MRLSPANIRLLLGRVILLLIGCLLGEFVLRAGLALAGDSYSVARTRDRLVGKRAYTEAERVVESPGSDDPLLSAFMGGDRIANPYVGFETGVDQREFIEQLELLRASKGKPGSSCVVLVLGGSVSEHFADPHRGGVAPVRERLASNLKSTGRQILFLGQGRAAYKQPQQLMWFSWLLSLGLEPDVLINLDGFNEVALAAINNQYGSHPLYPSVLHWGALVGPSSDSAKREIASISYLESRLAGLALKFRLHRSAVTGSLVQIILKQMAADRIDLELSMVNGEHAMPSSWFGPSFEGDLEAAVALSVEAWARASQALHDLCSARGIKYVHVLQPTLHDTGSKSLTAEERENSALPDAAVRGVQIGYPLLRAAGAVLAESGVNFIDASRVFESVEETVYFDSCHFVRPGTEILGKAIAAGF